MARLSSSELCIPYFPGYKPHRSIRRTPFLRQKSSISRTLNNNNQGVFFLSPVSHLLLLYTIFHSCCPIFNNLQLKSNCVTCSFACHDKWTTWNSTHKLRACSVAEPVSGRSLSWPSEYKTQLENKSNNHWLKVRLITRETREIRYLKCNQQCMLSKIAKCKKLFFIHCYKMLLYK